MFYLQICAAPPSVRRTKIHGDKAYHTALITINRRTNTQAQTEIRSIISNQAETKIYYSFRHVDVLTRIAKIHVVTIYIRVDAPVMYMSQTCGLIRPHCKDQRKTIQQGRILEVVRRKPGYNVYYFSVGLMVRFTVGI